MARLNAGTARCPLAHRQRRTGGRGWRLRLRRGPLARSGCPAGADARPEPSRPRQHAEQPRHRLRANRQSARCGALLPQGVRHRDGGVGARPPVRRDESQEPARFLRRPRTAGGVGAVPTRGGNLAGRGRVRGAAPPREPSPSAKTPSEAPIARKTSLRPLALGAFSVVAVLIVILVVAGPWGEPAEETARRRRRRGAAQPRGCRRPRPIAPSNEQNRGTCATSWGKTEAVGAPPTHAARPAAMPTVATAQLCTALSAWRCEAADSQVPPGPMFFLHAGQIRNHHHEIEHRWYEGDHAIRRAVQLRVEANPGVGYRAVQPHHCQQ